MNDEMKFLLVGRPDGDSVWLHTGPEGSGLSGWLKGTLSITLYPDNWLTPTLVLTEIPKIKYEKKVRVPVMPKMLDDAGRAGVKALKQRDTGLFIYSLLTQFCYQRVNGAALPACPKQTIARVYTQDHYSHRLYTACLLRKLAHSVLV